MTHLDKRLIAVRDVLSLSLSFYQPPKQLISFYVNTLFYFNFLKIYLKYNIM